VLVLHQHTVIEVISQAEFQTRREFPAPSPEQRAFTRNRSPQFTCRRKKAGTPADNIRQITKVFERGHGDNAIVLNVLDFTPIAINVRHTRSVGRVFYKVTERLQNIVSSGVRFIR